MLHRRDALRPLILALVVLLAFTAVPLAGQEEPAAEETPAMEAPADVGPAPAMPGRPGGPPRPGASGPVPYVDTHVHLIEASRGDCNFAVAIQEAIAVMDRNAIAMSLVMPPPNNREACDASAFAAAAARRPDRFGFLAGGGSLNPMIHAPGEVTPERLAAFEQTALEVLAQGAVGFGEMAALHLSYASTHPFEETPPDHPLFRKLADIAAQYDVPIDFHMDTAPTDLLLAEIPPAFPMMGSFGSQNPPSLAGNLAAFERLLDHNPNARIVWVHAGADGTGLRGPDLIGRLLAAHPNLYVQLRMLHTAITPQAILHLTPPSGPPGAPPRPGGPPGGPPQPGGRPGPPMEPSAQGPSFTIAPEWLTLIQAFPDRFVLGSDRFYRPAGAGQPFLNIAPQQQDLSDQHRVFLDLLPRDLAVRLAHDNVVRIYRLG